MSTINSNGSMAFGNALGGSVTIVPKNDTATNYTIDIDDVSGTLATQAWANSQDLGVGQTWTDVAASRVSGTTYTNSTGKPIFVMITGTSQSNNSGSVTKIYINSVLVSHTLGQGGAAAQFYFPFGFIVPNGATYSATISVIIKWFELR